MRNQSFNNIKFGRVNFGTSRFDREERGSVNLRKFPLLPGARRPLDCERIAFQSGRVAIALKRPRGHRFPALVLHTSERLQLIAGLKTGFLLEFALGRAKFIFARLHFSLRHEPGSGILLRPKRPA